MRLFVICILLIAACSTDRTPPVSADLVIEDVVVINVETGETEPVDTIIIHDHSITHIGPRIVFDATAEIIDGQGAFVVPGFWDAHVHSVTAADWHFPLMVRHGVTNVRNMHTTEPEPFAKIAALKALVASGDLVGPTMIANGPVVDGTHPAWPGTIVIGTPEEAESIVVDLKQSGADFIKVYDSLAPEVYTALTVAAQKYGLAVDGHMPAQLDPRTAAELGHRSVEHLSGMVLGCSGEQGPLQQKYVELFAAKPLPFPQNMIAFFDLVGELNATWDESACQDLVNAYADGKIAVTPTLVNGVSMTNPGSLIEQENLKDLVPEEVLEWWMPELESPRAQMMQTIMAPLEANTPRMLEMLKEAGVPIVTGTDVGNPFIIPGHSVHTEMALLVRAGLSPLDALRSATIVPSEVFVPERRAGRIEVGYEADLVLLTDNPLDDISHTLSISHVVLRGQRVGAQQD